MKLPSLQGGLFGVALFLGTVSCTQTPEVISLSVEGRRASLAEIEEDAWRLLPDGAVAWASIDAQALFEGDLGAVVSELMTEALPFAAGAGVDPAQDIDRVVAGLYATVGSDIVLICKGRFHKQETAKAIANNPVSARDQVIRQTPFSGEVMYVVGQVAMSVLSDSTLVFGTQLGVRRVLERIEVGRLRRDLPPWYELMLKNGAADFRLGIDLDSQPIPATLGSKLKFLLGMRAGRLLGNFRAPGVNLAGSLSYDTPLHAEESSKKLQQLTQRLDDWAFVMSALKITNPLQRMEARATGKNTQVVVELKGRALAELLSDSGKFFPLAQESTTGPSPTSSTSPAQ